MSIEEIGYCGAYCKKCKAYIDKSCKGCKIGYKSGERDIKKAKCKIKLCSYSKNIETCADCNEFNNCLLIKSFIYKDYSCKKCKDSLDFIINKGYEEFFKISENWKNSYGKLK